MGKFDIEKLADIEHQRWSHWQKYMHSKMQTHKGDFIIPGILVEHWERQIKTAYKDLSEREKEEDRKQVRRYLPMFTDLESENKRLKEIAVKAKDIIIKTTCYCWHTSDIGHVCKRIANDRVECTCGFSKIITETNEIIEEIDQAIGESDGKQ